MLHAELKELCIRRVGPARQVGRAGWVANSTSVKLLCQMTWKDCKNATEAFESLKGAAEAVSRVAGGRLKFQL